MYRPPAADVQIFADVLTAALTVAADVADYTVFCGDLNIDFLRQDDTFLMDVLNSFGLRNSVGTLSRVFANVHEMLLLAS